MINILTRVPDPNVALFIFLSSASGTMELSGPIGCHSRRHRNAAHRCESQTGTNVVPVVILKLRGGGSEAFFDTFQHLLNVGPAVKLLSVLLLLLICFSASLPAPRHM